MVTSTAGVFFSLRGGRMLLCFTYPKTFNTCVRSFFDCIFSVLLFGGSISFRVLTHRFGRGFHRQPYLMCYFSFHNMCSAPVLY